MADAKFHNQGYALALLQHRLEKSALLFPGIPIRLDTTQYYRDFFRKYGFEVVQYTPNGTAPVCTATIGYRHRTRRNRKQPLNL